MMLHEFLFKKTLPTFILVFFIVLINLVIIHRYVEPEFIPPTNESPTLPPYHAPYYGLTFVRPKQRKFTSQVIEDYIKSLEPKMKDKDLYTLLQNCLPNTLDTTVEWFNEDTKDPRTFLITGDSKIYIMYNSNKRI
ncbi:MAG: glycoside hydrolase family 125 protein [Paenibacillus sp.]|nr:glycoside hydrolase family 125 protein [Paenibacillus sp.]